MAEPFPPAGVDLPNPDWDFSQSPEVTVDVQKLGDGYEVRQPIGLNSVKEGFSPKWSSLDPEVAEACYDFLLPRLKLKGLMWTHPVRGTPVKVVAESVNITYDTWDNAVLEVTFRQDFNPG